VPRQDIQRATLYYGESLSVTLDLSCPLSIVSRKALGDDLLGVARREGVQAIPQRVNWIQRQNREWRLRTREGAEHTADYLVGADGATSFLRRHVGEPFDGQDLSVTMGYLIPGKGGDHLEIYFIPGVSGYLWSFPRPDHISWGLITPPGPQWTARGKALLENYIRAGLGSEALESAQFYSAPVPTLRSESWARNRAAGDGWALDHRDQSNDSRNPAVGAIPVTRVKGRALNIYWSSGEEGLRWDRMFSAVH
jgi:flavin-dependent dehydrogenase